MRKIIEQIRQSVDEDLPYGVDEIQPHKNINHPSDEYIKRKKRKSNVVPKSLSAQKALILHDILENALKVLVDIEMISDIPLEDRQELLKMARAIHVKFA